MKKTLIKVILIYTNKLDIRARMIFDSLTLVLNQFLFCYEQKKISLFESLQKAQCQQDCALQIFTKKAIHNQTLLHKVISIKEGISVYSLFFFRIRIKCIWILIGNQLQLG